MKDLTKGNIYKTFFLFGLPLVLSGLLSQAYGIIDTAIAGQFLGERALAAIGATSPLISFISSIFWGYGVGFSIYVARLYSSKQYEKIKSAVYTTYVLMFIVCATISALMIVFHKQLFLFLQVDESLYDAAFEYFFFYILGLFPIIFTANGVYIMNAFGIGSFPFYMSIVSTVLNIGGNILAVSIGLGIKGLVIASVFSALVVSTCYVIKFFACVKEMGVNKKAPLGFAHTKNSLPFAIPNMFQQMVMYFASVLISPLVNGIGVAASASYSVITHVYNIIACVYQNSARSISNYTAQCVGQKKYHKIKKGVWVGLLQGLILTTPFILICSIFHKPVCNIFLKADAQALTKQFAYTFAAYVTPFMLINLICNLFHGLFRGLKSTGLLFSSTLLGAISRLLFSMLLIPSMGMNGFFVGWILSWIAEALFVLLIFFSGRWQPKDDALT